MTITMTEDIAYLAVFEEACLQAGFSINLPRVPKVNRSRRLFALGRAKATVRFMSLAATSVSAVCRTRSKASKALKGFCWFLLFFSGHK